MIARQEAGCRDGTARRYANAENATGESRPAMKPCRSSVETSCAREERDRNRVLNKCTEREKRDGERTPESNKNRGNQEL